jgi:hypothetical protein
MDSLNNLTITLARAVDAPWLTAPVVAVGARPSTLGTLQLFGCVARNGQPIARLDIYGNPGSESYFQSEAVTWQENVVLGFGWHVYLISSSTLGCVDIDLPSYFKTLKVTSDYALAVFGCGILRFDSRGAVVWENDALAIDGVEIDRIQDNEISGRGDWDPPGDWRPFTISLIDGRNHASRSNVV